MFQIEQVTKLCSKIALTEPWDPYDIPTNSTFEDQYYIGGPGDQIMVQEWSDRKPARKLESWVGVYTVKDCYPVQETYTKNYSVTTSTRFFDLKLGIADPSVFTPPSTCQTAQPRKMKDECWLWTLAARGKQILARRIVINSQLLTSNLIFQAYCYSFGNCKFSLEREHKHLTE